MTETTENATPSEGDLPVQPTESPAPADAGRDATESTQEPDYKRMYLDAKGKIEEANRLKAELAMLKSRPEPSPAAPVPWGEPDFLQESIRGTQGYAANKDPVAATALFTMAALRELEKNRRLDKVPDGIRKQVEEHPRTAQGDIDGAIAEVQRDALAQEVEKLRTELARAATKTDPDVVRTIDREVPASERKTTQTMTEAQWAREQAEYNRRADAGDVQADKERMRRQLERRNGKIVVKG